LQGINILNPDELFLCSQNNSKEGIASLVVGVADFFSNDSLTEDEIKLATKITLNLVRQAEIDLREALSDRLAAEDNIPVEVINFLASDVISVAEQVLVKSPILIDSDLLHIISIKGKKHWSSIAKRDSISDVVVNELIDTKDHDTAVNLVYNKRNSLKEDAIRKLIMQSISSKEIQLPLLRRPEINNNLAVNLYMCVANELRKEITNRFYIPQEVIEISIGELVEELSLGNQNSYNVNPDMLIIAKRFNERGIITSELMINSLRRCQMSFFIAIFAEKIGFNPEDVLAMLKKGGGRPFALACKSLGMMKSEFASIFLLSQSIRDSNKVLTEEKISLVMKYFDNINKLNINLIMDRWKNNPEVINSWV